MRIAVFTDLYLEIAGGIPSSISAQKKELEKLGHTVVVFCPGFSKPKEKNVVVLPAAKYASINGAPTARWPQIIVKFVEKQYPNFGDHFDLIHSHYEAAASMAAVILARKYNLPLVQTMHGREDMAIAVNVTHPFKTLAGTGLNAIHRHFMHKYSKVKRIKRDNYLADTAAKCRMWELMVRQANCADEVITPSQHFADKLKHYGVSRPITPVSNGVEDKVALGTDWKIRKVSKASHEPIRIIWTSRLSKEKRIMPFLESLKLVKEDSDRFFFTAVGDGNEFEAAKKYVLENGLSKNVKFLGAVPHEKVLELLKTEHLSIINSYGFDTQGLTILEAAATGLPVIYCDRDMKQVVLPDAGMCAHDESPKQMAKLILDIINNPELIEKMSRAAMKQRKAVFQSTQIKNLLAVYEKALKKSK